MRRRASIGRHTFIALLNIVCFATSAIFAQGGQDAAPDAGELPTGADGGTLNLDFERGYLQHWLAEGEAFAGQPVKGDTVEPRRPGMRSRHAGQFWVGTFERAGDEPTGRLTSAPFEVTRPFASFLIGGGAHPLTRAELVRHDTGDVIFRASGRNVEDMQRVIADLSGHVGERIFIRLIDERSGGWGHINFDDFRLHATRPEFPKEPDGLPEPDQFVYEGLEPDAAAAAMTVPEGFEVTLFAGEPDVVQPIAMAIDDRGRLWIAEAYSYPRRVKDEEARDRILIFEDTDGDGRHDVRKIFAERLNLISGLEVGFGGVWVGAAPNLLFIPDRDGDDRPDGPAEVLLDGWGYQDTHETLNAFIWGPDGWLYGCHGVFTHSNVGKPGTPDEKRVSINAGIWRYHPTRHEFEVFAEGTSNPWGVDFDDHGQVFATACVIPHMFHLIQGARYHRQAGSHFNPHTYDDIKTIADHVHWIGSTPHSGNDRSDQAGGGHAHAGAMIYLGGTWPPEYRNQIFMNNIHGARINMDRLETAGSGYVARHGPDLLLANDRWSQIVNLRYGPGGQVYMIDWYDKNQCHRREENVHDRTNGRIFKVSYVDGNGGEPATVDLKKYSDAQLVEAQLNRKDWHVRHARRLLKERAAAGGLDRGVREALVQMATEHPDETRRLRALWALHVTGGVDGETATRMLADESPYVRGWTIQLALEKGDSSDELKKQMVSMAAGDPSPVVRRYLASAAGRMPNKRRWELLEALTRHPEDADDHNLPLLYWYAAEPLAEEDMSRALALAQRARTPLVLAHMVRRIGAIGEENAIGLLVEKLGEVESADVQKLYLDGVQQAMKGRRRVPMPRAWPAVAKHLHAGDDEGVRRQAEALAVTFGDPEALARTRAVLADAGAERAARESALDSLRAARDPELAPTLHELLSDTAMRGGALRALALYDDTETPRHVLSHYRSLSSSEKRDALITLASRSGYALALLDAIDKEAIARSDLSADIVRQLRNLKDAQVDHRVTEVWGTVRDTPLDKAALIAKYKKMLDGKTANADLSLGRAVFAKTCGQCHKLFGQGREVGPELTGSNRADLEYLLSNVLDPSALVAKDYVATTIATDDGRILTGIASEATDRAVTLLAANETVVIPRDEIDVMEASAKSMMPDDLFAPLRDAEVRAMVAYLASPAQVPTLATAENLDTFFNGQDLMGWSGDRELWSVENGEIVGRSDGIDHNEFLVSDLAVGDFRLSLEVKLVENRGNSGVQFRSQALPDGEVRGYQADIGVGWWGQLYEELGRGLLWNKSGESHVNAGEWNTYEIVAVGHKIRTWINGQLCVDLEDPPGARRGIIALQLHSGPAMEVRFRNLRLELDPSLERGDSTAKAGGQ